MKFSILPIFLCSFLSLFSQEIDTSDQYVFEWGEYKIPIADVQFGNNFGRVSTSLDSLSSVIDKPMFLYKNGEKIKMKDFSISVYNHGRIDHSRMIHLDNYNPRKSAKLHGKREIGHLLTRFSQVHILGLKDGDSNLNISFRLDPPEKEYLNSLELPSIPNGDIYEFQVVSFENKKTMLRIDTTNESQKRILKIYENNEKYDVVHIPGFKTTRRYIEDSDLLEVPNVEPQLLINNNKLANVLFTEVSEFTGYSNNKIPLVFHLGEMKNLEYETDHERGMKILTKRYNPDDMYDTMGSRVFITHNFKDFEIAKMRISLLPKDGSPISFITDHLNYPIIQESLNNIANQTIVLFDEIFLRENGDELIYLPTAFTFGIE